MQGRAGARKHTKIVLVRQYAYLAVCYKTFETISNQYYSMSGNKKWRGLISI